MKRILFYILMFIGLPTLLWAGTISTNGYFYLPDVGDSGSSVHSTWVNTQEATDAVIKTNSTHVTSTGSDHSYIDQDVTSGSSPTFTGSNITGIDVSDGTNLAVSGTLLNLSGDTLSVNEGTLTDTKYCTYESGTGIQCTSEGGSGSGTPEGSDTQVQFNDGGVFGGDAGMTYNKTSNELTVDSVDAATVKGFSSLASTTSSALYDSVYNLNVTNNGTEVIKGGTYANFTQDSGGNASGAIASLIGRVTVDGGDFDHAVGVLGWMVGDTVTGDYIGVEGRCDSDIDSSDCQGNIGTTYLNSTVNNDNTYNRGLVGHAILGDNYVSGGTNVGIEAYGVGATTNYDAIIGRGTTSGDNGGILMRGYITDGAGMANVRVQISDIIDGLYFDVSDAKLDSIYMRLRDSAGASSFKVADSSFATVLDVKSNGDATLSGDLSVSDEVYGAGWDSSVEVPTKNAVYDKIETISAGGGGDMYKSTYDTDSNNKVDNADIDSIGSSTYDDLIDWVDVTQSAGKLTGGAMTDDGDGTITVAAGTGFIKTTDSDVGDTKFFDWSASTSLSLTDTSANYIYVDYNSGTPILATATSAPTDHNTKILLGMLYKDGSEVHIITAGQIVANFANKVFWKSIEVYGKFQRSSGMIISATGTRGFALTAGKIYAGLTPTSISAFSTATATYTRFYDDGTGSDWTEVASQSTIDNTHYDDGSGTLASLDNGGWTGSDKDGTRWVYEDVDGHIAVRIGTCNCTLTEAQDAQPPSTTLDEITEVGGLVGKIIIQKDATSFTSITSPFGQTFNSSSVQSHNDLSNIQGGAGDDNYHIKGTEHTELTEWLDDVTLASTGKTTISPTVTSSSGLDFGLDVDWTGDIDPNGWSAAVRGYRKVTSSTTPSGGYHNIGVFGWAEDTVDGNSDLYGLEGRIDGHSDAAINYSGIIGLTKWVDPDSGNGTTNNTSVYGITSNRGVYDYDGSTPRNQGNGFGVYVPNCVGFAGNYAMYVADQTGATYDYGLVLGGADTITLWVGQGADNTDAANGIVFGLSMLQRIHGQAKLVVVVEEVPILKGCWYSLQS